MAVEVKEFTTPDLEGYVEGYCFRCTVSGQVFGPTMEADDGADKAEEFLQWCLEKHGKPRQMTPSVLTNLYHEWRESYVEV